MEVRNLWMERSLSVQMTIKEKDMWNMYLSGQGSCLITFYSVLAVETLKYN
jgi:hypothetical protein